MKVNTMIKNVMFVLALFLASTVTHSEGPLQGIGLTGKTSISTGIMEIDGVKMKFDGSTKVLHHDKTVDTYTKVIEVVKGTSVQWKARKGPRYPILLWIRPILS